MAANPIAAVGACCCGTLGIVFVLTFFFASVQTNTDHNKEIDDWIARTTNQSCTVTNVHKTDSESCRILNQTTTQRDCFEQHSCVCGSCIYGSSFCSVRRAQTGSARISTFYSPRDNKFLIFIQSEHRCLYVPKDKLLLVALGVV